jgi:hypothetical protein
MGLHTILKKLKLKEREMKLLVVGLDNAGKTTIVKKFNGEDIETISPTLGFQINTMEYKGYKLNIWDVGGQKTIRACATLRARPPLVSGARGSREGGGRRRDALQVLAQLLRDDRGPDLGGGLLGLAAAGGLPQ